MELFYDLFNTLKVVAPDPGGSWDSPLLDFMHNQILFMPYMDWLVYGWITTEMVDDYAIVPFPKGPDTKDYHSFTADFRVFSMIDNVKEKEKAMYIMNRLFDTIPGYDQKSSLEALRNENFRDDRSFDFFVMLDSIAELNTVYVADMIWGDGGWGTLMGQIMTGEKTPAAAVEEQKDYIQSIIDERLNN
jgi:hypothetical protein